jgi:hypothetical protein
MTIGWSALTITGYIHHEIQLHPHELKLSIRIVP